ncbi:glycosyltransferase family 4 protein [Nocardioides insulae]|uniref:glycosyltransferase family 4 protein n=1 Tax=Nocardioides insulae TaxID=394734 RepID=UPI00048FEF42|nr:glycosyltransferase family 4 protein [Nocardioides insulae]
METREGASLEGRHVAIFSWRDTGNPEAGGAEHYLSRVAAGLVERGARVTVFTAGYAGAPRDEQVDGVRFVRRGNKLSIYLIGCLLLLTGRLGRIDAVVDVQNGLPFFTPLVTRRPVIVLVHHVHREQWPVVYRGLVGRVGWWVESRLSPRLYRRAQYVTVSRATRDELTDLGVDRARIAVVHNGVEPWPTSTGELPAKTEHPSICVVGRLVPHKRVELAIEATVALRRHLPDARLTVVGSGWWHDELAAYVAGLGAEDAVEFTGFVDEETKRRIYAESWVLALPSLKEGWGLVVTEAGVLGTPTVAFRSAGGTTESVDHDNSGLLVDSRDDFVAALGTLLTDEVRRKELSEGARWHARRHSWEQSQLNFAAVLAAALRGERVSAED